jgi:hypothetical protein
VLAIFLVRVGRFGWLPGRQLQVRGFPGNLSAAALQLDHELLACTGFTSNVLRAVKVSAERASNRATRRTELGYWTGT